MKDTRDIAPEDRIRPDPSLPAPCHDALTLTGGGTLAKIALGDQVYTLRITQARKLILTK